MDIGHKRETEDNGIIDLLAQENTVAMSYIRSIVTVQIYVWVCHKCGRNLAVGLFSL